MSKNDDKPDKTECQDRKEAVSHPSNLAKGS
jgi:hypothetical protein